MRACRDLHIDRSSSVCARFAFSLALVSQGPAIPMWFLCLHAGRYSGCAFAAQLHILWTAMTIHLCIRNTFLDEHNEHYRETGRTKEAPPCCRFDNLGPTLQEVDSLKRQNEIMHVSRQCAAAAQHSHEMRVCLKSYIQTAGNRFLRDAIVFKAICKGHLEHNFPCKEEKKYMF